MSSIAQWRPIASVGNPKLDEQHIVLLELGRTLLVSLETHGAKSPHLQDLLSDIANQFQWHIVLEEQILEANACPTLIEHRLEHKRSIETFLKLLADASQGRCDQTTVAKVINDWMTHHIIENDLPSARYLIFK
jgi:hemerythrin-like metal-binding protein